MKYFKLNHIKRDDFFKINEEDVMFITCPGRMGNEDGSTFIVKEDNKFIAYRVSGWLYNTEKCEVTFEEMLDLCVDRRISNIFDKHLEETMIRLAPIYETTLDDYALKYNSWDDAAYETAKDLKYDIEHSEEETKL